MPIFTVAVPGQPTVEVQGDNWLIALGRSVGADASSMSRLACEVLANGTVIARDLSIGRTWVVQVVDDVEIEIPPLDESDIETLPDSALVELAADEDPDALIARATSDVLAAAVALSLAEDMLDVESSAVILTQSGGLRFVAVRGPHAKRLTGVRLPPGSGVAGHVLLRGKAVVVHDARNDPRHFGEIDAITGYRTRQMAVVPIPGDGRILGVLEVMNRRRATRFESSDVARLVSLAASLGKRLERGD